MESEHNLKLIEAAKKSDDRSFNKLCDHYKGFIIKTARDINPGIDSIKFNERDLLHAGNIGIYYALNKYDPESGYKFITYAGKYIEKELSNYIKSQTEPLLGRKLKTESLDTEFEYEDGPKSKYENLKDEKTKSPDSFMDEIIQHPKVVKILDKQSQKDKKIINMYYGLDEYSSAKHTMKEIADELKYSVKKVKSKKEDIEFQIKQSIFFDHLAY